MSENPQKENGYIQIATGTAENDVLAALIRAKLTGVEFALVLHVIRKTWGYNKKNDWISLTQFQNATGYTRSYIVRSLQALVTRRILVTEKSPGKTVYGFNKRFLEWVVTQKSLSSTSDAQVTTTSDVQVNQVVTYKSHTKEKITKEKQQKKTSSTKKGVNPSVQKIMDTMNDAFGQLDSTEKMNRRYAWLLIQKAMKAKAGSSEEEAAAGCVSLIRAASKHDWWGTRIKKVETVYKNAQMIAEAVRTQTKKSAVIKI